MKYGLIGERLGHSFSREIHELLDEYDYELIELSPNELEIFLKKKDFNAINVTIPYKEKVIPYLDYISKEAEEIKAVNTIVNKDGKLYGYNTDYYGVKELLKKKKINTSNNKVLILGTGGSSKTVTAVLKEQSPSEIIYVSRTKTDNTITYAEAITLHNDANIIINTTPCGMYPNNDDLIIDINHFKKLNAVVDIVYNPLHTRLIVEAKLKNITCIGGLYMLITQAIYANALFMNKKVNTKIINQIYKKIFNEKNNIVLIGMPSAGKTTIGRVLATRLNKDFVDIDQLIIEKINMDINSYFKEYGEEAFRKLEAKIIKDVSKDNNLVISTGGGAILNEENMKNLKNNGFVFFINRFITNLIPTDDRPLSSNQKDLNKLYKERLPLYKKYADYEIDNNSSLKYTINHILSIYEYICLE